MEWENTRIELKWVCLHRCVNEKKWNTQIYSKTVHHFYAGTNSSYDPWDHPNSRPQMTDDFWDRPNSRPQMTDDPCLVPPTSILMQHWSNQHHPYTQYVQTILIHFSWFPTPTILWSWALSDGDICDIHCRLSFRFNGQGTLVNRYQNEFYWS